MHRIDLIKVMELDSVGDFSFKKYFHSGFERTVTGIGYFGQKILCGRFWIRVTEWGEYLPLFLRAHAAFTLFKLSLLLGNSVVFFLKLDSWNDQQQTMFFIVIKF